MSAKKPTPCNFKLKNRHKLFCTTHKQYLMYIYKSSKSSITIHCQVYEDEWYAYSLEKQSQKVREEAKP